jgi:hypothetical protein
LSDFFLDLQHNGDNLKKYLLDFGLFDSKEAPQVHKALNISFFRARRGGRGWEKALGFCNVVKQYTYN